MANEDFKNFETPVKGMLPFFSKKDISPTWNSKANNLLRIEKHELSSQLKAKFGSSDMTGRVSVVNFFFATCPGYCPRITSNIKKVHKSFTDSKRVKFVSYSVTPNIDTIDKLTQYAKKYKIDASNWHFVRGDRKVIYNIARNQLIADLAIDLNKDVDQFVHSESIYLIDRNLYVRGIYNSASKRAMAELKEAISLLLK